MIDELVQLSGDVADRGTPDKPRSDDLWRSGLARHQHVGFQYPCNLANKENAA